MLNDVVVIFLPSPSTSVLSVYNISRGREARTGTCIRSKKPSELEDRGAGCYAASRGCLTGTARIRDKPPHGPLERRGMLHVRS